MKKSTVKKPGAKVPGFKPQLQSLLAMWPYSLSVTQFPYWKNGNSNGTSLLCFCQC